VTYPKTKDDFSYIMERPLKWP